MHSGEGFEKHVIRSTCAYWGKAEFRNRLSEGYHCAAQTCAGFPKSLGRGLGEFGEGLARRFLLDRFAHDRRRVLRQISRIQVADIQSNLPPESTVPFEGSVPLKRFLLIFKDLILDSSVVRGIPSFSAAPEGP